MRISDVLFHSLDGIDRLVDLHEGELDLGPYLNLPEGVEHVLAPGAAVEGTAADERTALLDLYGPDIRRHRPIARLDEVLAAMAPGRRAFLLFGYEPGELPVHRVLDALHTSPCRIDAAVPLSYQHITVALVVERVASADDIAEHNLLLLTEYGARTIRTRVHTLEAELDRARGGAPRSTAVADDTSSADRLRIELEALRDEFERVRGERDKLRQIEKSTTYQVGRVVIDAFSNPGKRTLRAPANLAKLWRRRGRAPKIADDAAGTAPTAAVPTVRTERFLVPFPAAGDTDLTGVLTIAGVWRPETERVLAPDCRAITLHPNQAATQLRRTHPDVLLVQSSAAAPGTGWAALGTPPGLARDRELATLLEEAARCDVPTVLWYDRPPYVSPGLDALADRFDLVLHDRGPWSDVEAADAFSLGVQLGRFGVLPPGALGDDGASVGPAFLGALDPRLGHRGRARLASLLRAAVSRGLVAYDDSSLDEAAGNLLAFPGELAECRGGYLPPSLRPATYRRHRAWIGMPAIGGALLHTRTLEQVASGARVAVPHPVSAEGELKQRLFDATSDVEGALHAASEPVTGDAHFVVLRELHRRASTAQWLGRLARLLTLPVDPADARATALVFLDQSATAANELAATTLAQRRRPAQVVVHTTDPASAGAFDAVRAAGVPVEVVTGDAQGALDAVTAPFTALVTGTELASDHLADLHVVHACARTDLVSVDGRTLARTGAIRAGELTLDPARSASGAAVWQAPAASTYVDAPNGGSR
jgi:hypothetical protein